MNNKLKINVTITPHGEGLALPSYETLASAGMDLRAAITESCVIRPGQRLLVPSGFRVALPVGYEAQIRPRSGLALKHGITVLNSPGTIDADYRGEVGVILINHGEEAFAVERGMRIAQMVIAPVQQLQWNMVTALDETDRGQGGFGSTGMEGQVIECA